MTADEGRRPSPDDETPADDSPSTPSTSDADDGDPEARSTGRADSEAETTDTESGATTVERDTTTESDADGSASTSRERGGEERRAPDPVPGRDPDESFLRRLWTAESGPLFFVRELGTSAGAVLLVGLVLFGLSGVWPPMVAVESGSMEPHMHKGDLVFIMDEERFPPDGAVGETGIVTHRQAAANDSHWSFGDYGNVIVYKPDGDPWKTPIIHRARFHVERGENWVDPPSEGGTGKAKSQYLGGATTCAQVRTCPAPYDGFVTLGDANRQYDQVAGQSGVVKSEWIRGRAKVRIPYLGYIRLLFGGLQAGVSPDLLSRGLASLAGAVGVVGLRRAA